ncbi:MAG: FAD-dependent oxidoreductase [Desulforhopalus sp.]|nr:FAD-dependent oxidoreductase [Desulforhopalus sp.]
MEKQRYVIIGGSAAGMAAAEAIRRLDPGGMVRVLSDEADAPYFRPLIPFLISQKKRPEEIFLQGRGPYQGSSIEVWQQHRVAGIDTRAGLVTTENGATVPYDKLLIATGSSPNLPSDIDGLDCKGVFALRTLADARQAADRAACTTRAVMLGGGLLNLKAAFALLERGISVYLVVSSPEVLSQLMEPDDAFLIRQALDQAGLKILTGRKARHITSDTNGVTGVVLDNGDHLPCEMVCIGKGVRPNTGWLNCRDITVDKGVVVDKYTRTSAPNVYAAGDVAVTFDPLTGAPIITGLWTNAVEMGSCAGSNMAGHPRAYGGTFGILNATQVARMPFVSMGIVHTSGTGYQCHSRTSPGAHRKLVFSPEGDRLVGAIFVGDIAKAGLYRAVIREKLDLARMKDKVLDHRLHYGDLLCARGAS